MASVESVTGVTSVFVIHGGWVWDRWQRKNENNWRPDGGNFRRFAPAPNAVSVDAFRTASGVIHVVVRNRDGSTQFTIQRPNETSWGGAVANKQVAGFSRFTPVPK